VGLGFGAGLWCSKDELNEKIGFELVPGFIFC